MPPDSVWSDQFNKSEIQLNLRGIGWKNLMNDCLEQTEIFKGNKSENEGRGSFDPNLIMNMRHKLIKEYPKTFPTPRGQTQSEAFKLLREEYHDKMLKHKQEKLVESEIVKLRQILENHRMIIKKKLEETSQKVKPPSNGTKLTKYCIKLPKGLESCPVVLRKDAWFGCSVQALPETEVTRQENPGKPAKTSTKSRQQKEETPKLTASRKGSLVEGESERESDSWKEEKGKEEILRRFLEEDVERPEVEEVKKDDDDEEEEVKVEEAVKVPDRLKQNGIQRALKNWKNCDECKNSKTESRIEGFLSRLREKKMKQEKTAGVRVGGKAKRKMLERREKEKDEQIDEKLKKLMQEVKSSQKEAQQKLQEAKTNAEIGNAFLLRMEERREERLKRRRKFEERKLKMEEEKENLQRQREEEKRQREEEEKRRKVEEVKEKRRAEKERKEEQKREREKMRVNMGLAVAHHRVHLLRGYGLRPWVRLMRVRESQQQQAEQFFERRLKERTLRGWMATVRKEIEMKVSCALTFYEDILKRDCMTIWVEALKKRLRQNQAAVDWYDFKMVEKSFKRWEEFAKTEKWEYKIQSDRAVTHHEQKLKQRYLQKLRDYPTLKKLEQAKENRKWKWRQKVKELLPDYEPVDISDNF